MADLLLILAMVLAAVGIVCGAQAIRHRSRPAAPPPPPPKRMSHDA